MKIKPTLRRKFKRNWLTGREEMWVCRHVDTPFSGYGTTPFAAYQDWVVYNRYIILDLETGKIL